MEMKESKIVVIDKKTLKKLAKLYENLAKEEQAIRQLRKEI